MLGFSVLSVPDGIYCPSTLWLALMVSRCQSICLILINYFIMRKSRKQRCPFSKGSALESLISVTNDASLIYEQNAKECAIPSKRADRISKKKVSARKEQVPLSLAVVTRKNRSAQELRRNFVRPDPLKSSEFISSFSNLLKNWPAPAIPAKAFFFSSLVHWRPPI